MRRPPALSLRLKLLIGAGLIAAAAVAAAGLAAWGSARTASLIGEEAASRGRTELLGQISARVSDYALVAVEAVGAGLDPVERQSRLAMRAALVREGFAALDRAYGTAVVAAERLGDAEQAARATRGIGLARMRAHFETLARDAPGIDRPEALRAALDGFATRFAPLVGEAVEEERRTSTAARAALERLGRAMHALAIAIAVAAAGLLVLYYFVLVRPLVGRLDRVGRAAREIGHGRFDAVQAIDRRDEIGLVLAQIRRMATRLARGRRALERDRARLSEIVAERTAELTEANARLAGVDAERRRFFADIGHELRTPLTVILAEADLGASGTEGREALKVIGARARRLNRRIEDLLRVARSESGQIELEDRPFDLGRAAAGAIEDVAPLARRAKVTVAARLEAAAVAQGDADWSRQVIAGVIENAIRHSRAGEAIEVALAPLGDTVALSVTDEGEGVAEADRERIFERHQRGGDRPARGLGFGVGLALARWIMERQGGAIALESPVVRQPVAVGEAAAAGPAEPGTRVMLTFRRGAPP